MSKLALAALAGSVVVSFGCSHSTPITSPAEVVGSWIGEYDWTSWKNEPDIAKGTMKLTLSAEGTCIYELSSLPNGNPARMAQTWTLQEGTVVIPTPGPDGRPVGPDGKSFAGMKFILRDGNLVGSEGNSVLHRAP